MQSSKFVMAMVCAVAAATTAPTARSDAPCDKGYRDSTPAERATMTAVLQAAKKKPFTIVPDKTTTPGLGVEGDRFVIRH